jgi:7-carboxy-7-deazaguanine synthase
MSVDEVIAEVQSFGCPVVEITGGEPLLQADVYPLMRRLVDLGHTVMLETGGHRSIADVPAEVIRIVDVKCPASGEADKNHWPNLEALSGRDEVKFVIQDRADYEFAKDVVGGDG